MRLADPPGIRDYGHDLTVLVGDHCWSCDSHAVQHAEKIGAEEWLPVLRLLLPEGFARNGAGIGARVARVIDQDIDFAEGRARFFKHRVDRCKIGHVALRGDRFDAQLFNFGGDRLGALETEIVDDYSARIVLREAKRDHAADALSGAGHEADAALEIENVAAQVLSSGNFGSRRVLPPRSIARFPAQTFPDGRQHFLRMLTDSRPAPSRRQRRAIEREARSLDFRFAENRIIDFVKMSALREDRRRGPGRRFGSRHAPAHPPPAVDALRHPPPARASNLR